MSKITDLDALNFHSKGKPGKIEITSTKPLTTQRDLSLAYSPGVAVPCLEIVKNPNDSYKYTNRGNTVAVITNGSAVLGLGNIGALASKPVMEGKAVLFKKFADIDGIDLELDTNDTDEFINAVKLMGPSFGGINLEDIKAPECFIIEEKLKELMDIPVFHDDQHGTAIVAAAGLINSTYISGKKISDIKLVVNGAGAASIACVELAQEMGVKSQNIIMCDSKGVIYKGRTEGMNQWKDKYAVNTKDRTLADAMVGADAFFGLSVGGALSKDMVKSMANNPIIFAMANPTPEITPDEVKEVRDDAIVATGRSDYPNQVNNVLGFPFIFRGALDVRATSINQEMKIAAANAIAQLARQDIPEEILESYGHKDLKFGKDYIIPMPFDYRLMSIVPAAVAQSAMDTGVARQSIKDMEKYINLLKSRIDPTVTAMEGIFNSIKENKKTVIFSNGTNNRVIRAAASFQDMGYGKSILVGNETEIREKLSNMNIDMNIDIADCYNSEDYNELVDFMYKKVWRKGFLKNEIARLIKNDRNIFSIAKLLSGKADAMIGSTQRTFVKNFEAINTFIPTIDPNIRPIGIMMLFVKGKTIFIADTVNHSKPNAQELANIAEITAGFARRMGHTPRVAFTSFSNFGDPQCGTHIRMSNAVKELDKRKVNFEYDGEMIATIALNYTMQKEIFPNTKLSDSANILITPGIASGHISSRLIQELGDGTVIGPMLLGFDYSVQIPQMASTTNDLVNLAALSAYDVIAKENNK